MGRKRASGGARAVAAKHAAAEAARNRKGDYNAKWLKRYSEIVAAGVPKTASTAYDFLAQVMLVSIEEAMCDPGMKPEARREQIGRLVAQAAKVMDPARMAERLEELERALEEANARDVPPPAIGAARARAPLA